MNTVATRRRVGVLADIPADLWRDKPARDTYIGQIMRGEAQAIAAKDDMTIPGDQPPHGITVVFGRIVETLVEGELRDVLVEVPETEADVARVRACWWAQ